MRECGSRADYLPGGRGFSYRDGFVARVRRLKAPRARAANPIVYCAEAECHHFEWRISSSSRVGNR